MIYEDIQKANIDALKNHDKVARSILSVVYGNLKLESINKGLNAKSLDDADAIKVIQKAIKQLDEERIGYVEAKREETVKEIDIQKEILQKYLPQMMSEDEIRAEISKLSDKSIPAIMKHFKANFNGKCEMSLVSKVGKEFN